MHNYLVIAYTSKLGLGYYPRQAGAPTLHVSHKSAIGTARE